MPAVVVLKLDKNVLPQLAGDVLLPDNIDAVVLVMKLSKRISNTDRMVSTNEVVQMMREAAI